MFLPWRIEQNEVEIINTKEIFDQNSECILENRAKFDQISSTLNREEALAQIERELEQQDDDRFASQAEVINRADDIIMGREALDPDDFKQDLLEQMAITDPERLIEILEEETGYHADLLQDDSGRQCNNGDSSVKRWIEMDPDEYKAFMSRLNKCQSTYLLNVLSKIKRQEVFYEVVVGDSGTGKSNLIKAINQCVNKYLRGKDNSDEHKSRVILSAFTGKAAFNIGGVTLHGGFHITLTASKMCSLSVEKCLEYRKDFDKIKLIIIDEISMVGSTIFKSVHLRMQEIMGNMRPFGGVSVICFGDFKQLPPVLDNWVFTAPKMSEHERFQMYLELGLNNPIAPTVPVQQDPASQSQNSQSSKKAAEAEKPPPEYVRNPLWAIFKLYSLTEIMRQANDKTFAEVLSTLGRLNLVGLTEDQRDFLDTRIIADDSMIPPDAIYLYMKNEDRIKRNEKQLRRLPGKTFVNRAWHIPHSGDLVKATRYLSIENNLKNRANYKNLELDILLKIGARYMITSNIEVSDGLVNGTTGTLMQWEEVTDKDDKRVRAKRLWFDFYDPNVGKKKRQEDYTLYKRKKQANGQTIPLEWTPLDPTEIIFQNTAGTWSIKCLQYSIDIAEAVTVCKAQGQTYQRVAIDISITGFSRALLYVALSRVPKLEGLYLFGCASIFTGKDWKRWSYAKRMKKALKELEESISMYEMGRMKKEQPFLNIFPFLEEAYLLNSPSDRLSVCMQNVRGLHANLECIRADFSMRKADVLIFVETHVRSNYAHACNYELDEFKLVRIGSSPLDGAKNGCALYVSTRFDEGREYSFVCDNSARGDSVYEGNRVCELAMVQFYLSPGHNAKRILIMYGYSHPEVSKKEFFSELQKFIDKCNLKLKRTAANGSDDLFYLIGDFNIDLKKKRDNSSKTQLNKHFRMIFLFFIEKNSSLNFFFFQVISNKLVDSI